MLYKGLKESGYGTQDCGLRRFLSISNLSTGGFAGVEVTARLSLLFDGAAEGWPFPGESAIV